jgi:tryptophan synthase alpha chain
LRLFSERTQRVYEQRKKQYEALLIGYLIAGDPSPERSLTIIENAILAGLDILELGIPSQRPYMDGPIIQAGHARVAKYGANWLISFCRKLRQRVQTPIWAMGYNADLFSSQLYEQLVTERLIDGLVLPECSNEEIDQIAIEVKDFGIDVVRFVQPTMTEQEIAEVAANNSIIYAQTYAGATGATATLSDLPAFYQQIHAYAKGLVVAGFGLKTPDQVREVVRSGFSGAVVGSALVDCCGNNKHDELYELIHQMKNKTDLYMWRGG